MLERYWCHLPLHLQMKIAAGVFFYRLWFEAYNLARLHSPQFIRQKLQQIALREFNVHWVGENMEEKRVR